MLQTFGSSRLPVAAYAMVLGVLFAVALPTSLLLPGTDLSRTAYAAEAIASLETNVAGLAAEIIQCQRSEGELSIRMLLRNVGGEVVLLASLSHDNFYLTAKGKKYYLIQDKEGNPLAIQAGTIVPVSIAKDRSWIWWGKFTAPPADVTYISYYTPWTLPLDKLPITD